MPTDLEIVRRMADHVSVYLYCPTHMPTPLNSIWLAWIDSGLIPTEEQLNKAIYKAQAWSAAYKKTYGYKIEQAPESRYDRLSRGSYINTAVQEANRSVEHLK